MAMESARNPAQRVLIALLAGAGLLLAEPGMSNDAQAEDRDIADSPNERTPAVTAFPKYPLIAWRDRVEGETTVCFSINAEGRIVRPSVRRSTHRIFEKPAMRAIRDSSFAPLEPGAEPAAMKTCRTYRFRLDPVNADNRADRVAAQQGEDGPG